MHLAESRKSVCQLDRSSYLQGVEHVRLHTHLAEGQQLAAILLRLLQGSKVAQWPKAFAQGVTDACARAAARAIQQLSETDG